MFIYIRDRKKSEYTFVCLSPDDDDLPCPIAVKRERVERGVEAVCTAQWTRQHCWKQYAVSLMLEHLDKAR